MGKEWLAGGRLWKVRCVCTRCGVEEVKGEGGNEGLC